MIVESIGDVHVYVQDMHPVWEEERSRSTMSVQPGDAVVTIEKDFPVSPLIMWDFVTGPEYKAIIAGSKTARVDYKGNGRIGEGAIYYCAHNASTARHMIADWRPPDEYSYTTDPFLGINSLTTIRLSPTAEGTRVSILVGEPTGGLWIVRMTLRLVLRPVLLRGLAKNLQNLHQRIEVELEEGGVVQPFAASVPAEEVGKAIRESLNIQ